MKLVIEQPNYLPWKGYFDLIDQADVFVWYDDVQYTHRDWRNRNKIKTPQGLKWITVPVEKFKHGTKLINEVKIKYDSTGQKNPWYEQHLKTVYHMYHKQPYFNEIYSILKKILPTKPEFLCDLDISLNEAICEYLGIKTKFIMSSDYPCEGEKQDHILELCEKLGADEYLSGPKAKNYIEQFEFEKRDISLEYIDYEYGTYQQPYGSFEQYVSIVDTISCLGKKTINHIRGKKSKPIEIS